MPLCPIDGSVCKYEHCNDGCCRYTDDGDDDYDYDPDYDDIDPHEEAMMNCHWNGEDGEVCGAAGSEHCDWECPFSAEYRRGLEKAA